MSSLGCFKVGLLLERRAAGLSEAERLVVEEHLSGCAACGETARSLDGMRRLVRSRPPLTRVARERAIGRALSQQGVELAGSETGRAPEPAARALGLQRRLLLAAALFATFALLVVGVRSMRAPRAAVAVAQSSADSASRLVAGDLRAGDHALAPGSELDPGALVRSETGASLRLGHAAVELGAGSAARWDAPSATLLLESGRVKLDVAPGPERRLRVATARFIVEVAGTLFEVELGSVRVLRGKVRVLSADGERVLALLGAGESWAVDPAPSADPASAPEAPVAAAGESPSKPIDLDSIAIPVDPGSAKGLPSLAQAGAAQALLQARRSLAAGNVAAARRSIELALRAQPTPAQRAEAQTLLAECALVSGESDEAARRYRDVAERHAGSAAGENALFAAARLEARAGRTARARELFDAYLRKYPQGRFEKEAAARLKVLETR